MNRTFTHRGHKVEIDRVLTDDYIQYLAEVTTPDGRRLWPDIGNAGCSSETSIRLWIDAGYPSRPEWQSGPLRREQLEAIIAGCTEQQCNDQRRHAPHGCPMGVVYARTN